MLIFLTPLSDNGVRSDLARAADQQRCSPQTLDNRVAYLPVGVLHELLEAVRQNAAETAALRAMFAGAKAAPPPRQTATLSPTLHDVAERAGVSIKTVSRVVNKEKYVAEATRQQVARVIDTLGYVPHVQAQRLASGRTRSIVLHYPLSNPNLFTNQIEMSFIFGTAVGTAEEVYFFSLMTGPLTPDDLLRLCRGSHTDGLVLMQIAIQDARVQLLRESGYRFVMVGRSGEDDHALSFIDLDLENAVMEAFAHLIGLGHRRIAFLNYPEEWRIKGIGPAVRAL